MSKKRKTRKQKETAVRRHNYQINHAEEGPSYSISEILRPQPKEEAPKERLSLELSQKEYLKKDITKIAAATGIVFSFDILLYVLLTTGILHLHILGY